MSEERLKEILWEIYEGFSDDMNEVINEFRELNKKNKELEDTIERFTNALNSAEKLIIRGSDK